MSDAFEALGRLGDRIRILISPEVVFPSAHYDITPYFILGHGIMTNIIYDIIIIMFDIIDNIL